MNDPATNENESGEVRPLNYLAPVDDEEARRERRRGVVQGAIVSGGMVFGGVFLVIMAGLSGSNPAMGIGVGIAALTTVTLYQHFARRRSGFLAGVLIGIGIAALIEGACFVALIR